jgi:hypothetical protein
VALERSLSKKASEESQSRLAIEFSPREEIRPVVLANAQEVARKDVKKLGGRFAESSPIDFVRQSTPNEDKNSQKALIECANTKQSHRNLKEFLENSELLASVDDPIKEHDEQVKVQDESSESPVPDMLLAYIRADIESEAQIREEVKIA